MKWLHISDIHFDFINDGTATKMLQDNFFSFIEKNNIAVDELFFTGDFRHAKNQKNQDIDIVAKKAINLFDQGRRFCWDKGDITYTYCSW